jgi:site-specific DNA-methyltransferase (adenine-specific)
MTVELILGDCLEVMRSMPDKSVDAVITDPPYYRIVNQAWDSQWKTLYEYILCLDVVSIEWRRILKDNGSLYLFADDKTAAYIQVMLDKKFLLINNIVWHKTNALPQKNAHLLRSWAPMTERILFYSAQYDPTGWKTVKLDINNFMPLREYFRQYQEAMGLNIKQINGALGHRKAEHAFYWGSTQWDLPTAETYAELAKIPSNHGFVRREYEDLRREYEDLRREYEDLRRPFNADGEALDVITGPIVSAKDNTEHPTTKPLWLMQRLVTVSTNPDMTVLDCFMGSGTTGVACVQTGRDFIGIEIDPDYFNIAKKRIEQAQMQPKLL